MYIVLENAILAQNNFFLSFSFGKWELQVLKKE